MIKTKLVAKTRYGIFYLLDKVNNMQSLILTKWSF